MKVYNKQGIVIQDIDESKEISRGGEGRIIDIGNNMVAKIYLPNVKPLDDKKFIELSELKSNTFIKPEVLLFDINHKIIGFIMQKVPSSFFPLLSIFNKTFCTREGISFKTKEKIFERIIDAVKFAHSKNIIIGDLNPYNILVNEDGLVYFIDVDSYETPSFKHSNVLLEDIRDFLYGGGVNIKSDYFSLSVLAFNALTFVHPYKGICKTIPKIGDRMINKLSVLNGINNNVIIPKCYEPLTNNNFLLNQFEDIFNNGNRFVLDLINKVVQQPVVNNIIKPIINTITKTNELVIHTLLLEDIVATYSSKELLVILNNKNQLICYDVSLKGNANKTIIKENFTNKDKIFVHKNEIYCLRNNILFNVLTNKQIINFDNKSKLKSNQYNNIIVIVSDDTMYKFDLNNKYNDIISYETISVFGGRFVNYNGLHQNVSGNSVLFYEKNGLNTSILKTKVKDIHQTDNFGVVEIIENETIKYKLFSIKNLQTQLFDTSYNNLRFFDALNENMIVVPEDDKLLFVRTEDMQPIINFTCNEVSENSIIHCTNAGIIVVNQNSIYLINKK